ncbi:FAD:protein FMN transferase [Zoogloea sp.]|uniref:FAD:protein FMN transferase n=1 Tax=Zoogloea sp. TaxID=49181 RepID=UPI001415A6B8|nr:MAG: FAD:protein FMN transferase [Zoogloea sp.]
MKGVPVRRMRPLLGTYVQVEVIAEGAASAERAMEAAFLRIEAVHRAMSFHTPDSELSQLNREAHRQPVAVGSDTLAVLRRALYLSRVSDGRFDPCIAPHLVRAALLPAPASPPEETGRWSCVHLDEDRRTVRFSQALWLDLGGLAKGYAVDAAIEAIAGHPVERALVNAGGDMRAFRRTPGQPGFPVSLRNPADPRETLPLGQLEHGALATSGEALLGRPGSDAGLSPLVDPTNGLRPAQARSITVAAPECWLADGLTKIVGLLGPDSQPILDDHGCHAAIIDPSGHLHASPGFWQAVNRSHPPGDHSDA